MTMQNLFVIMVMGFFAMAWYANTSKRNKILCTFRRINKTKIAKWIPMKSQYVFFDGGKYTIISSRITFQWYSSGLIHMIFPQWVATLDYSYNSEYPHDPNNMLVNWATPEVANAIKTGELVSSYFKTQNPASANKKQDMLTQYLPYIAILMVVLLGVWVYTNFQQIGMQLIAISQQLKGVPK